MVECCDIIKFQVLVVASVGNCIPCFVYDKFGLCVTNLCDLYNSTGRITAVTLESALAAVSHFFVPPSV